MPINRGRRPLTRMEEAELRARQRPSSKTTKESKTPVASKAFTLKPRTTKTLISVLEKREAIMKKLLNLDIATAEKIFGRGSWGRVKQMQKDSKFLLKMLLALREFGGGKTKGLPSEARGIKSVNQRLVKNLAVGKPDLTEMLLRRT